MNHPSSNRSAFTPVSGIPARRARIANEPKAIRIPAHSARSGFRSHR